MLSSRNLAHGWAYERRSGDIMLRYFAYGSNMSLSRLRARAPGARLLGTCLLRSHVLRFHKIGRDGSGKCDAFFTGDPEDLIIGALCLIEPGEKPRLDQAEGLGQGYDQKIVTLESEAGAAETAVTYYATIVDERLRPYSWYKNHVLVGARELALSAEYVRKIEAVPSIEDPDRERDASERAIYQ